MPRKKKKDLQLGWKHISLAVVLGLAIFAGLTLIPGDSGQGRIQLRTAESCKDTCMRVTETKEEYLMCVERKCDESSNRLTPRDERVKSEPSEQDMCKESCAENYPSPEGFDFCMGTQCDPLLEETPQACYELCMDNGGYATPCSGLCDYLPPVETTVNDDGTRIGFDPMIGGYYTYAYVSRPLNTCQEQCLEDHPLQSDSYVYCVQDCAPALANNDGDAWTDYYDDYPECEQNWRNTITREHLAKNIHKFMTLKLGYTCPTGVSHAFTDVAAGSPLNQQLDCLVAAGVFDDGANSGYGPWEFGADWKLDRYYFVDKIVKMMEEATGMNIVNNPIPYSVFLDIGDLVPGGYNYWRDSIVTLYNNLIIPGKPYFRGGQLATQCILDGTFDAICDSGACVSP